MSDYSFLGETNNGILVFVKYLGDNEITLEYDKTRKKLLNLYAIIEKWLK